MTWKDKHGLPEIFPAPWFADAVNGIRLPAPNPPAPTPATRTRSGLQGSEAADDTRTDGVTEHEEQR